MTVKDSNSPSPSGEYTQIPPNPDSMIPETQSADEHGTAVWLL
jgi:hypothetical protein